MWKLLPCLLVLSPIVLLVKPNPSADVFNLMKHALFSTLAPNPYCAHGAEDDLKPGLKYGNIGKMKVEKLLAYPGKYQ